MSTAKQPEFVSVDDYLAAEELGDAKHEYIGGWVRAMSGGSLRHNWIKDNAHVYLGLKLHGKTCRPFSSDTKIRIRKGFSTKFYYPDVSVVCDSNQLMDVFQDRPVLLIEVLSSSTRAVDLDEKLEAYLTIESLDAYVILEQHKPMAVVMRRCENGFLRETYEGLDAIIELPVLGLQLPLAEVYSGIEFPPTAVHDQELSYEIQ